jgi:uncharacterized protein
MNPVRTIPMFPLSVLPLPGELVPLHIFEPRYKQLLQDAEHADVSFGIYFNHTLNLEKIGSLMKLESIIKRYPGGESDIIVKCVDIFYLDNWTYAKSNSSWTPFFMTSIRCKAAFIAARCSDALMA